MQRRQNGQSTNTTMGAILTGIEMYQRSIPRSLWGVGCVQLFCYLNTSPSSDIRLRSLAVTVWLLDTIHQALLLHTLYFYLIIGYNEPSLQSMVAPSLVIEVLFCAMVCLIVQTFFILRIWRFMHGFDTLTSMRYLASPLAVLLMTPAIASFISSAAYASRAFYVQDLMDLDEIFTLGRLINIFSASGDSAITISLVCLLRRSIHDLAGSKSETVINRIIMFTMGTGLITSLCATMALIMMSVSPNTYIYMAFYFNILYTNSLFATLNSRDYLQNGGSEGILDKSISLLCFADSNSTNVDVEAS